MKTERQYLRDKRRVITQLVKDLLVCGHSLTVYLDLGPLNKVMIIKDCANKNELIEVILKQELPILIVLDEGETTFKSVGIAQPPHPAVIETYSMEIEYKLTKTIELENKLFYC